MSGIAAIIRFDGGEVEPGAIERMTAAMNYRGPDGIAHWRKGPVALGHCMLHTTAESLEEVQPLANEDGSLLLVMDGWLSNWSELRRELLQRGAMLRSHSDAELVLRAYEAWGEECPRHIEGEFAFLVWDSHRRTAYIARDHAGLRPLLYHWNGRQLAVASDMAALLAAPGIPVRPNRGMAAEVMSNEWLTRGETIWQNLNLLIPAHWIAISSQGLRTGEYWKPRDVTSIVYPRDEDYFAHYRELLFDCVRRSSRTHLPLACDVSGGLDSSAIFCVADTLASSGELPAPALFGYSYLFDGKSDACETDYARAVASHTGASILEVRPFLPDVSWFAQRGRADRDLAPYPNAAMAVAISEAASRDGCRVHLNGEGGDEWVSGKPFYYYQHLAERDWAGLARSFREDSAAIGMRRSAWHFWRHGLGHFLPRWLLDLRRKLLVPHGPNGHDKAFWLAPELDALLSGRRRNLAGAAHLGYRDLARRSMYMALTDPFGDLARVLTNRQNARSGREDRSPMYLRPFIEFAFATPERIRMRGNTAKFVHVEAMKGLLPEAVRNRRTKAEFSIAFSRQLDKMQMLLTDTFPRGSTGNLSASGMRRLYESYTQEPATGKPIWELWGIFSCENAFDHGAV